MKLNNVDGFSFDFTDAIAAFVFDTRSFEDDDALKQKRDHFKWLQKLAESCQVVNLEKWNHNFPKWPAAYVAE